MTASLTNRAAVVRYLLEEQPHTVWIVAAGWRGGFSLEDTICAGAIGHLLSVERDSDCSGDDESIAAVALFEQWQERLPQLLRYAHHGAAWRRWAVARIWTTAPRSIAWMLYRSKPSREC